MSAFCVASEAVSWRQCAIHSMVEGVSIGNQGTICNLRGYDFGWSGILDFRQNRVVTPNARERAYVMSVSQIIYSLAPTITGLITPTIAAITFGIDNIWTYRIIYPPFTIIGVVILLIFFPKLNERIILPKRGVEYVRYFNLPQDYKALLRCK